MYSDYGAERFDPLTGQVGVVSGRASGDVLCHSFSLESEEVDDVYKKPPQEVQVTVEALSEFGVDESLAEFESTDQNLEAQLHAESDSLEEWEGMVQIRLMVLEAVWKGVVRAVEDEASKAVEVREAELMKVKQELQGKDSTIYDLSQALKKKDDELAKVDDSRHHELQDEIEEGMDVTSYCREGKNTSFRLLQGEVEQLNYKNQERTSAQSILIQESGNCKAQIEDQHNEIGKQESTLHDTDRRCHMPLLVIKHLQDKIVGLNTKLLEYEEAAQLGRAEMQEQNWKHEEEITIVMTIFEGRMMDLETELSNFGEDIPIEAVISKSRVLQRLSSELKNLRSSKAVLESRLEDTVAALSFLETSMRTEQQKLPDKADELNYAESRMALLKHNLCENERLLQHLRRNEVAEMRNSGDSIKEQQKASGVVEQWHREEQGKTLHSEQEHKTKQVHSGNVVESLEEKVWLIDIEKMFITSYMETAFQDFRRMTLEIISLSTDKGRCLGSQGAADGADIDRSGVKGAISSDSGSAIQQNMRANVQEFSEAQVRSTDMISESEELKGDVNGEHTQFEMFKKDLEEKVFRKEEEITNLQEALEERHWQSQVENILILGFGEGLCQHMMEIQQQVEKKSLDARNEVEDKNRCVAVLEKEVSQLRDQIVLSKCEQSSVNRQMKVGFEGQFQTMMTLMQRLEGDLGGKVEQFDSRVEQAHDTIRQMRKGFEGQVQTVMESVQRLEGDLAGEVEQFDSRLQHADCTIKQLSQQLQVREAQCVQVLQDLQKAEVEVDYLGDDVDALMGLLEKVYIVLSHYHPVIQLYPGLADLSNLVSEEFQQHVCASGVV